MKKGFSLIELMLVLSVGLIVSFMKFQDMKNEQDLLKASVAGEQIKRVGDAVNNYISVRYDKLSTLKSSSSQSSDPGPRICTGNICTITIQTLKNEGILPPTYSEFNSFKSPYSIVMIRNGNAPNYVIDALITTSAAWIESGDNPRYDLLGFAMQKAGVDSGMTKSKTKADGYNGSWSEKSSSFNNITKPGQLAYRAGYNSSLYSVYLRRDGTLPMTGDLNMGGRSINNAQDITAAGTINAGILHSTGSTTVGTDLNVGGNGQVNGNLNSNSTVSGTTITSRGETYTQNWFRTLGDGGIYFQKWGGGWNMTDPNTIQAYGGKNIQTVAGVYGGYIHSSGNIDSAADMNSNRVFSNYIQSNGRVVAGEYVQINGQAQIGGGCSPNGLQGRTAEGAILSCVNGVWTGGSKVNRNQCMWLSAPNAFSFFGKRAWELHEKPVFCPDNYIMVGTKMWGWAEGVDDEHVDAYCCPLS